MASPVLGKTPLREVGAKKGESDVGVAPGGTGANITTESEESNLEHEDASSVRLRTLGIMLGF